jgi:hypothetical protein
MKTPMSPASRVSLLIAFIAGAASAWIVIALNM